MKYIFIFLLVTSSLVAMNELEKKDCLNAHTKFRKLVYSCVEASSDYPRTDMEMAAICTLRLHNAFVKECEEEKKGNAQRTK